MRHIIDTPHTPYALRQTDTLAYPPHPFIPKLNISPLPSQAFTFTHLLDILSPPFHYDQIIYFVQQLSPLPSRWLSLTSTHLGVKKKKLKKIPFPYDQIIKFF